MNKDILRKLGFGEEVKKVEQGQCPICNQPVDVSLFPDEVSRREFEISGICLACQRDLFSE